MLELLRLAPHEIPVPGRPAWLAAVRGPSGVLLPRVARLRVGAHAAGDRSENWNGRLEPAGWGSIERQVRSRTPGAGRHAGRAARNSSGPGTRTVLHCGGRPA